MKTISTTLSVAMLAASAVLSACGGGGSNGNGGSGNSAINWPAAPNSPGGPNWPASIPWPGNNGNSSPNSNSTPGTNTPANPNTAPADGPAVITPVAGGNAVPITVDGKTSINQPYVTITVCAPNAQGSSQCATVDRMILDTGSTGVRIMAGALGKAFANQLPPQTGATDDPSGNAPIAQCATFGSGFTWGSIKRATVSMGSETSSVMPVQVIGDGAFATPADCITHGGPDMSSVAQMGANGLVGISNLVYDDAASAKRIYPASYYYCTSASACVNTRVPVSGQPMNPVAALPIDNNGTIIRLPSLSPGGADGATGQLIFGIGTQSNNAMPAGVNVVPLDQYGYFTTVYKGRTLNPSAIDSGTNMLLFPDSTIATTNSFYTPASPLSLSALFRASNGSGTPINIPFGIANANTLWVSGNSAFNNIGANASGIVLWGLPFFYGRSVYTVLENATVNGQVGPFAAF
ncbi:DUF3443 family protein [Paraburkholderia sp. DHOC27]|uniref:DUF3443 family protein n=1 Tax=Paraburkholderia sp. DHOC27 TaxID=2303330 RepID=UPI000E3EACDF|nr:DUF3443 family protein [Paraburkholderia sp. DHOC27]RFU46061.1 DUF3443 family protein [Paraburkholderia sp. DHOC27]